MRSDDYRAEFGHVLDQLDDDTRALVLAGDVEICPACGELSAHAFQDANAYGEFPDGIIPGGFDPEPGTIAHIPSASCFEFECGHCRRSITPAGSPLTAEVYTHRES